MILDFPTKEDFFNAANGFLNESWGSVLEHLTEFEALNDVIAELDHASESKRYWASARQTLVGATALVQQAVEFYIKGRIVSVSPYLLITGNPQSWPKGCNKMDIGFSEFRTLDAQDLIKVHDTVCKDRFTQDFIQWNNRLRTIRNKVIHTVDKTLVVTPGEVVEFILYAYSYFNGNSGWFESRKGYQKNTPVYSLKSLDLEEYDDEAHLLYSILCDYELILDVLSVDACKEYLNYDFTEDSMHCPMCSHKVSMMDYWGIEFIEECAETYQRKAGTDSYLCKLCGFQGRIIEGSCFEEGC